MSNQSQNQEQEQEHKGRGKVKGARVTCPICLKPAVVYNVTKNNRTTVTYEHRDETPVKDFVYHGRQYHRYRRCYGGVVHEGLPYMSEEEPQQQQQPEPKQKEEKIRHVKVSRLQENYKKKYWDLANGVAAILYSNETPQQAAKRKIEMLGELMKEFKK